MKYLLCIPHSIYFSWISWFGGKVEGGELFLLWTVKPGADAEITLRNLAVYFMREDMILFKGVRFEDFEGLDSRMVTIITNPYKSGQA